MKTYLFLFFFTVISILNGFSQTRYYVSATGSPTGTGTSWATACSDLQLIINTASARDTIWVAQGTYVPIRPANDLARIDSNNRDNAFAISENISIYGGFTGMETQLSQRDWKKNLTILSGDIGTLNDNTDNCYHVVITHSCDAYIDGFTITKGNATGTDNLIFQSYAIPRGDGGGIYNGQVALLLINSNIINNTANWGGGIYNENASFTIRYSNISNNIANWGGGIYDEVGSLNINYSNISYNTANENGGGILKKGGLMLATSSLFSNNQASTGGAIYSYSEGGEVTGDFRGLLVSVTITKNMASNAGAIYHNSSDQFFIYNSILYGNTGIAGMNEIDGNSFAIIYSLIQNVTSTTQGNINGNTNPLFKDPNNDNFRLQQNSPVIDVGNNSLLSIDDMSGLIDLDGRPRIINGTIGCISNCRFFQEAIL